LQHLSEAKLSDRSWKRPADTISCPTPQEAKEKRGGVESFSGPGSPNMQGLHVG